MKKNKYRFFTSEVFQWPSKCLVTGNVIGYDSQRRQIQEVKETIYYFLWFRVIVLHDFKFTIYQ